MLHSLNDLRRFSLEATDDTMGSVKDLYFIDSDWSVRYLVANSGFWFFGRDVLIGVQALAAPNLERTTIPVALSRQQIKELPTPDEHKPVSRQHEHDVEEPWPSYLAAGDTSPLPSAFPIGGFGPLTVPTREQVETMVAERAQGDPHLRSAGEIEGYAIHANDGDIGKVRDVIVDRDSWRIRYLAVDTGTWLHGHEVVLSVDWVRELRWETREIVVNVSTERIENAPKLADLKDLKRSYEEQLYRSYGYPGYWV